MNPIAIGMDLLLAGLLLAALWMGAKLNGRLKALRESHQGFAEAVQTLDAAAAKADTALKELRAASEDAHDSLLARIDTARSLALKLEKASETAENAARRAEEAFAKAPTAAATAPASPRRSLNELLAGRPAARSAVEPDAAPPPVATPRRRSLADEDLFSEVEERARPALSGLMRMSLAKASERGAR